MNLTLLAARELQRAIAQGEQGVVLAAAHVLTGMEVGAALADDDVARSSQPRRRTSSRPVAARESRDRYG